VVDAAAAVCFADKWRVQEKLGANLARIHVPATNYTRISPAVFKFFESLVVGAEKVRYNFTFCERPDLHIGATPEATDCPLPETRLPHEIYVRVERQALLRLPRSGGVLFTIRTYQQNIANLPRHAQKAMLATLDPTSSTTPLTAHQKATFGDRIRAELRAA
jgi:hypothetical protein